MSQKKLSKIKSNKLEADIIKEVIIDDVLQRIKNNFVYVQSKTEGFKLTKETIFSEMTLSAKQKLIKERKIKLTDFKKGDQVSVVVKKVKSQKIISVVRRIIVLKS